MLEVLYQDAHLIAINKPNGLLVHRSPIANDTNVFAVQLLRDQVGQYVYPAHRLDRKTSGVLLFALSPEINSVVMKKFQEKAMIKKYLAIVRGYTNPEGEIDYALKNENGKYQEAVTNYRTIIQNEIPVPFGKHQTSRYSLVEVTPQTGRMHQIRKHFAHILHPIIGDRPHGCNKQNRLFKEKWQMEQMMLHAQSLKFEHPASQKQLVINADPPAEFQRMLQTLNLQISNFP